MKRVASFAIVGSLGILVLLNIGTAWAAPTAEPGGLSPQVALDWNLNAVNAVRAYRTMDGVPAGSPARP